MNQLFEDADFPPRRSKLLWYPSPNVLYLKVQRLIFSSRCRFTSQTIHVLVSPSNVLFLKGSETHLSYMHVRRQEEEEGAERSERITSWSDVFFDQCSWQAGLCRQQTEQATTTPSKTRDLFFHLRRGTTNHAHTKWKTSPQFPRTTGPQLVVFPFPFSSSSSFCPGRRSCLKHSTQRKTTTIPSPNQTAVISLFDSPTRPNKEPT